MRPSHGVVFPPFHLDPVSHQLWCDAQLLPLRPKTFAVLCYLVEHAGVLVTKEALLTAVWPDTVGVEDLPKRSVHELRKVLGDEAGTPRFIETLSRRGWRFIAEVVSRQQSVGQKQVKMQKSKCKSQTGLILSPQSSALSTLSWSVAMPNSPNFTVC